MDEEKIRDFIKYLAKNHRKIHSSDFDDKKLNASYISERNSENLKLCPLCEYFFKPKKNQRYCEICRELYYPMYRDLKRGRIPFFRNGSVKTPAIPLPENIHSVIYNIIFIQASIETDFLATLGSRSAARLGELSAYSSFINQFMSGFTGEIVHQTCLNLRKQEEEILELHKYAGKFIENGVYDEVRGDIYIKPCERCGEPLITIKPRENEYEYFFEEILEAWAPEMVIGKDNIDYIKRGVEIGVKPQAKYHPNCRKDKDEEYMRKWRRNKRDKFHLTLEERLKTEKNYGINLNNYELTYKKGTDDTSPHAKEDFEEEMRIVKRLKEETMKKKSFFR